MTRKDYILIAMAVADTLRTANPANTPRETMHLFALQIADALARDNARFDQSRFIAACKVQS